MLLTFSLNVRMCRADFAYIERVSRPLSTNRQHMERYTRTLSISLMLCFFLVLSGHTQVQEQKMSSTIQFELSFPKPDQHRFHVKMNIPALSADSIVLKMPQWTPGYYQLMNYGAMVEHFGADRSVRFRMQDDHTWIVYPEGQKEVQVVYDVKTDRKFVAKSWVDGQHAYIVSAGAFLYVQDQLSRPVELAIKPARGWTDVATGLDPTSDKYVFTAPDADILYDCPLLLGKLESLPSFIVQGIPHRFIGYQLGDFNRKEFMADLEKIVKAATDIMGDIPYREYSFIGIGPGMGGIEHLNNTTISFDGKGLSTTAGKLRMYNFLAHEYFHHYNAKRIRPVELGPFNYEQGSRTNLLWISEGLTVYYEYLVLKKAGLTDEQTLLSSLSNNINAFENGPGKANQSLAQASYETWSDGPFGRQGKDASRSISYYDKGPVIGLLLDLKIRQLTRNTRSLNDVMRALYRQYYQTLRRGFTDAEFQQICEKIAGESLTGFFEYVYTAKPIDYAPILLAAGLQLEITEGQQGKKIYQLIKASNPTPDQRAIYAGYMKGD